MTLLHQAAQKAVEAPALKQVLDALRLGRVACEWAGHHDEAATFGAAMEAARSLSALQQQPEPVAWRSRHRDPDGIRWGDWRHTSYEPQGPASDTFQVESLYTAPPALQHQEEPREPVAWHTGEALRRAGIVCGRCGCPDLMYEGTAASPSTTRPTAGAYTWPSKACPCGSVQRDECQDHGCKWECDPSLVPMSLRQFPPTTRQQEVGSDTARLDWLEQDGTFNFYKVLPEAADKNGHRWRWRHESEPGVRSSAVTKAMPSLRAALDAARAAAPSTPEKAGGVSAVYSLVFDYPGEDTQAVGVSGRDDLILKLREDVSDAGEADMIEGIADQLLREGVWHDEGGCIRLYAHGVQAPIPHPLPAQANDGGEHG